VSFSRSGVIQIYVPFQYGCQTWNFIVIGRTLLENAQIPGTIDNITWPATLWRSRSIFIVQLWHRAANVGYIKAGPIRRSPWQTLAPIVSHHVGGLFELRGPDASHSVEVFLRSTWMTSRVDVMAASQTLAPWASPSSPWSRFLACVSRKGHSCFM